MNQVLQHEQLPNAAHEYIIFQNAVSKDLCNEIIDLGKGKWEDASITHLHKGDLVTRNSKRQRQSEIAWCTEQKFIDLAFSIAYKANATAQWNFQIDFVESMQIAKYGIDGHFDFHNDGNGFSRTINNKTRKLSMSLILNDDYEGGQFEFFGHSEYDNDKKSETIITDSIQSNVGDVIVFPSYIVHRVKPVTKGTRYSLVAWFCGEPFR